MNIRRAAAYNLTDQAMLAKVAAEGQDVDVRSRTAYKLTDQALLVKIAMEDKDSQVRTAAVHNLTDQDLLATLALACEDGNVYEAAVSKLTDQGLLAKVATEHRWRTVGISRIPFCARCCFSSCETACNGFPTRRLWSRWSSNHCHWPKSWRLLKSTSHWGDVGSLDSRVKGAKSCNVLS